MRICVMGAWPLMCAAKMSTMIMYLDNSCQTRPQGYKTFFMLNSAEHEISTSH